MTDDRYMTKLRQFRQEIAAEPSELMEVVYRRTRTHIDPDRYCPICRCTKSGDANVPNTPTDACETGDWHDCRCHDGWQG